jgi:hypothetical protein
MNILLRVPLNTSAEQSSRLRALQAVFAQACNALAPIVQQTKVWNRVALHHLMYRNLRERFPELGSQMVCNAIYSVSRTSRLVFQSPQSPFNLSKLAGKPLPLLRFTDQCPVYFDRHTLSIKPGQLSLFTMDGRMRFDLTLEADKLALFEQTKLREMDPVQRNAQRILTEFKTKTSGIERIYSCNSNWPLVSETDKAIREQEQLFQAIKASIAQESSAIAQLIAGLGKGGK